MLVGIVVVSHSRALAEAAVELSLQMVHGDRPGILVAAGTADGGLGTDATQVASAITAADQGAGVLILTDLGSAIMSAEFAVEMLEDADRAVRLVAAPFVEGLVAAVVCAASGASLDEVAQEACAAMLPKQQALGLDEDPPVVEPTWQASEEARVMVINPTGLHARPVASLVGRLGRFDAEVRLRCRGREAAGTSPIALATLGAREGDEVWIGASGAQAAEAVACARALFESGFGELDAVPESTPMVAAPGPQGVSAGRVVGIARIMADPVAKPPARSLTDAEIPAERARLAEALTTVAASYESQAAKAGAEAAQILRATASLARDPELLAGAEALVDTTGVDAARAIWRAANTAAEQLRAAGGALAERATDLIDIRDRTVSELTGRPLPGLPVDARPFVLVARDLAPSDTATLSSDVCLGIITAGGGPTSHTSILARSMGIPAVVGCPAALSIPDGTAVLVDGTTGEIIIDPDEDQRRGARTASAQLLPLAAPGATRDGVAVPLLANVGAVGDSQAAAEAAAEGIGLFRTEICFLDAESEPTIEQQVRIYHDTLTPFKGRRVVVRTLDAGSDKPMPFLGFSGEGNPALGVRGYRTASHAPGILTRQLAAIARAAESSGAETWVMAPMISTPVEAAEFAALAHEAGLERVGVMVETPSAALQAREILEVVDFISVGTNDLIQYTMAADRQATTLGALQDPWQPAVLRLLDVVGSAGREQRKPVGVCGEAAADPEMAPVLVGLGVTSLSMSLRALEPVRRALTQVTMEDCRRAAAAALAATSPTSAREAAPRLLHGD